MGHAMESTPVVFKGRLLDIEFIRGDLVGKKSADSWIRCVEPKTGKNTSIRVPFALGTAIVVNSGHADEALVVFGTSDWFNPGSRILAIRTSDLVHWTEPREVFRARADQTLFNLSVTQSPRGYVMAIETTEPKQAAFSPHFLQSLDLMRWEPVGGVLEPNHYAACPTIRYFGGWYYIAYLRHVPLSNGEMRYVTFVARSKDLLEFEFSDQGKRQLLAPPLDQSVLTSASDLDFVEHEGMIYFFFALGNQGDKMRRVVIVESGNLQQYLESFFVR